MSTDVLSEKLMDLDLETKMLPDLVNNLHSDIRHSCVCLMADRQSSLGLGVRHFMLNSGHGHLYGLPVVLRLSSLGLRSRSH